MPQDNSARPLRLVVTALLYFFINGTLRILTKVIMNLSLFLFLIGILGFILNRKNLILLIISIEIMLLAVISYLFYIVIYLFVLR
jgi:hypothetical protein